MKILVIRVGRVGDMVMCTPALSALLEHYPNAEFTLLTSADGKRVLGDFNSRLHNIWIYKNDRIRRFFTFPSLRNKILQEQFDAIFCFESNRKFYSLLNGTSAKVYGLQKGIGDKHFCLKLLDVVSNGVGEKIGSYPLRMPVADEAILKIKKYLEEQGITPDTILIAFHPAFSGIGKRRKRKKYGRHKIWPADYFGRLAENLYNFAEEKGLEIRVVMNLLAHEIEYGKKIVVHSKKQITILSPEPNFNNYKAFLQRVDLLITPDTGPMHLAAALGTPMVALFSGQDPGNCGPFGNAEKFKVLRAEDYNDSNPGIADLTVENVFKKCKELIPCGEREIIK